MADNREVAEYIEATCFDGADDWNGLQAEAVADHVIALVREQVAREIEADEANVTISDIGLGMRRAAWIARGTPGKFGEKAESPDVLCECGHLEDDHLSVAKAGVLRQGRSCRHRFIERCSCLSFRARQEAIDVN